MNNEKYLEKLTNICGYDNTKTCIKNDCTDRKLCRECDIMKKANPDEYNFYQNRKINKAYYERYFCYIKGGDL